MKQILVWLLLCSGPSFALIRGLKERKDKTDESHSVQQEPIRIIDERHKEDSTYRTATTTTTREPRILEGKKKKKENPAPYSPYSGFASERAPVVPGRMEGAFLGTSPPTSSATTVLPPSTCTNCGNGPAAPPTCGGGSGSPTCAKTSGIDMGGYYGKGGKKTEKKDGKKVKGGKGGGKGTPASPVAAPSLFSSPGGGGGPCGCRAQQVELDFVMTRPNVTVPIAQNSASNTIGTQFIYNDGLFDLNLTALPGTFLAGMCWRTQLTRSLGPNNTLVGAGYCQFTVTITDGDGAVTFNAVGEVFDVLGGTLAVTGGTGDLRGAYGEVEVVPVYENPGQQSDFFLEAAIYVGSATLLVPIQPATATPMSLGAR